MKYRIVIFGAGSWGTALAISLAESGHPVTLWARRKAAADAMERERRNPNYLSNTRLPDRIHVVSDLEVSARENSFWVIAAPSQAVRELAERLKPFARSEVVVVSVAKGIENGTLLTPSQILTEVLDKIPGEQVGVLSGPSHAEEVAEKKPTTLVASSMSGKIARDIQNVFMTPQLRVYVNTDLVGVEIGGAVKNVLALAAGISDGVGYGDNAKAAIITRGIAELQRFGVAMGARPETFAGLAGLGDLVVTCTSKHSRNRYFGEQIGRGRHREEIENEMKMIAEGVKSTVSVRELARIKGVEMPITEAVYSILVDNKPPAEAVYELMTRTAKPENGVFGDY